MKVYRMNVQELTTENRSNNFRIKSDKAARIHTQKPKAIQFITKGTKYSKQEKAT